MRVAIAGVPKAGKTTLSAQYGQGVRHTDDLLESHNWHDASTEVARWFNQADVVEGVRVPHALRKWLADEAAGTTRRRAEYSLRAPECWAYRS